MTHPFQKVTSHYTTENFNWEQTKVHRFISLCAIKLLRVTENSSSGGKKKSLASLLEILSKRFGPRAKKFKTPETRRRVLKLTYAGRAERTYPGRRDGRQRGARREREARREDKRSNVFVRLTSDIIAPPSSPCKPASVLGGTTRDSGKDRRRAFFKYKQHLPVCVKERERGVHVFKHTSMIIVF